jgi:hypothetical protein
VLYWFGHRGTCDRGAVVPRYDGDDALVCERCMSDLVPRCALCDAAARVVTIDDEGFRHHAFHYLCAPCRARVLAAGDARARRAAVTARRVEALLAAHPGLHVDEMARRRASVRGSVARERGTRAAWITVRDSARASEAERFVVRVGLAEAVVLEPVVWVSALRVAPCAGSPKRVVDRGSWLWCGFRHLGNADLLHVLDVMCDAAERAER